MGDFHVLIEMEKSAEVDVLFCSARGSGDFAGDRDFLNIKAI